MNLMDAKSDNQFLTKLKSAEKDLSAFIYAMFINRSGRISRIQFIFSFGILFYCFILALDTGTFVVNHYFPTSNTAFFFLLVGLALIFQRPLQALFTKRLHDIKQSGWIFFIGLLLAYCTIPVMEHSFLLIGMIKSGQIFDVAALKAQLGFAHAFLLQVLLFNSFLMFVLFFKKGTTGENQYGNDPLQAKLSGKRFSLILEYAWNYTIR